MARVCGEIRADTVPLGFRWAKMVAESSLKGPRDAQREDLRLGIARRARKRADRDARALYGQDPVCLHLLVAKELPLRELVEQAIEQAAASFAGHHLHQQPVGSGFHESDRDVVAVVGCELVEHPLHEVVVAALGPGHELCAQLLLFKVVERGEAIDDALGGFRFPADDRPRSGVSRLQHMRELVTKQAAPGRGAGGEPAGAEHDVTPEGEGPGPEGPSGRGRAGSVVDAHRAEVRA